jgi:hypothetical protein
MAEVVLSAYEVTRLDNIRRNAAMLSELGLTDLVRQKPTRTRQPKRAREPHQPLREPSRRARALPVDTYVPGQHEAMAQAEREAAVDEGRRLPDGSWLGERFGDIDSVPVGTTFGAGDFQRLGRKEMTESGFFRPFVTPEWVAPGQGCYSIILNNDNGASTDDGDTILYAGSGGRRRGQNRTAPQSFDQDWSNMTNAALRLNWETKQPVRVIRGPKLPGEHGTGASGGGYRYDGLYTVESAELVRLSGSKLRTAMFTLLRSR